ncbi:MAG: GNAT family N-acetyltransferase [Alphaproteobacteria bacterium]|nr:GNAT family N-acetyltransferase [Alphaproteobacteria bacterium]
MTTRAFERIYAPEAVALVGASPDLSSISGLITRNLAQSFKGRFHPVNPRHETVAGFPSFPSLSALPERPDLVIVSVPADMVLSVLEQAAAMGAAGATVITDVKRGTRPARELREDIRALARASGMRVTGPNCLGVSVPRLGLFATMSRILPEPGTLAFVGQSATAAGPIVDWAADAGLGFSALISLGDMADIDYSDVLLHLAESSETRAILLYLEEVPNARRLLSAARTAARVKPVIAIKTRLVDGHGESEDWLARDIVYEGAFARAGLVRVRTLEELFDALEALAMRLPTDARPSEHDRLAILANGESMGTLALDALIARSGTLAGLAPETLARIASVLPPGRARRNPVDILADADGARYRVALEALLGDPGVDAVLALSGPTGVVSPEEHAQAVVEVVETFRRRPGRRWPFVMASWPGSHEADAARKLFARHHVASFETPSKAVTAFTFLTEHARRVKRIMETPASVPEAFSVDEAAVRARIAQALDAGMRVLPPAEAEAMLAAYGMTTGAAPGGAPDVTLRVRGSLDREFGPVLALSAGGAMGARLDPGVVALPPLNESLARDILAASRAASLLPEGPGRAALLVFLMKASQLLADHPEIVGLDFGDIEVRGSESALGIAADSAHIAIAPREAPGYPARELAIRPYPKELEAFVATRGGKRYFLRPIRPEDEPALREFGSQLTPEDRRLRFFQPLRELGHEFAARLTQIDYDRQMAFVLTEPGLPGHTPLYGVVRLILEAGDDVGEFAVTVRSDLKGAGLGRLLLETILGYARRIGLKSVYGVVLRENAAMLGLAHALGFAVGSEPREPSVVRVARAP